MNSSNMSIDLVTPQVKVKRRSSFFNIEDIGEVDNCRKKVDYFEKLKKEKQSWIQLINGTHENIKK